MNQDSGKMEMSDSNQYQWQEAYFSQWDTTEFHTNKRLKFFKLTGGLKNPSPSFNRVHIVME